MYPYGLSKIPAWPTHVIVERKNLEKKDENENIIQVLYFEIEKRREICIIRYLLINFFVFELFEHDI